MTPELDKGITALRRQFPAYFTNGTVIHLGISNCRRKNNTADGPWSEHAWSNAVDVMLTSGAQRRVAGDAIAAWMRSRPDLWAEVFWQVPGHLDHPHGTAQPRRNPDNNQIPPCAPDNDNDGDDMPLSDADVAKIWDAAPLDKIAEKVWFYLITDPVGGGKRGASHHLASSYRYAYESANENPSIDADAIADEIAERLSNG